MQKDAVVLRHTLSPVAAALLAANQLSEAADLYRELLHMNREKYGERHKNIATVLVALGRVERRLGRLDAAERSILEALDIDHQIYRQAHYRVAIHYNALAVVLRDRGDAEGALAAALQSQRIAKQTLDEQHPDNGSYVVGMAYLVLDDYPNAVAQLRHAVKISEQTFGSKHRETAISRAGLGYALVLAGERRQGVGELDQALADLLMSSEPDPASVLATLEKRVRVALQHKDSMLAKKLIAQAFAVVPKLPKIEVDAWRATVAVLQAALELQQQQSVRAQSLLYEADQALRLAANRGPYLAIEQRILLAQAARQNDHIALSNQALAEAKKAAEKLRYVPRYLRIGLQTKNH
jgi:eukaryotic-like serine/threonine-protein kinase